MIAPFWVRGAFEFVDGSAQAVKRSALAPIANTEVFIAFTDDLDSLPGTFPQADTYRYSHYAIFARANTKTASTYFSDQLTCNLIPIKGWTALPGGTMFALGDDLPKRTSSVGNVYTIVDGTDSSSQSSARRLFPFDVSGTIIDMELPFLMFNGEG